MPVHVRKVVEHQFSRDSTFASGADWVFLSDIEVFVNRLRYEFVGSKSFELKDGTAILQTTKGDVYIPGKKISWR
jgi:hypothetical protein